jgi:hypothetical protein
MGLSRKIRAWFWERVVVDGMGVYPELACSSFVGFGAATATERRRSTAPWRSRLGIAPANALGSKNPRAYALRSENPRAYAVGSPVCIENGERGA